MLADPVQSRTLIARLRAEGHRGAWLALLTQMLTVTGGKGSLISHEERPWASATFAGSRQRFTLEFEGEDPIAGGEALIAQLPDHEFAVPGHLVADAAVVSVEHSLTGIPRMLIECDILLLSGD